MKKKLSLIALAFAMFAMVAISALLFSGCDFLFANDDSNNSACPPHTWKWVITTPPPVISGGDEDEEGEDDENYSIATQHCTKCNATGRIIIFPEGTDISDLDNFDDTNGNNNGNVNIPQIPDAEWQLILDRVNLLVDNHFENRDFDQGQNANWNITGLSVGIYKNGRMAFFNRGYHESEQRNLARRRTVTENSIFLIGSVSKPVSTIMLSYFSRINNPATGRPYVNLNDPVNNYFKTAPYIDTDGTEVHPTLLQFVTHRMGGATGGGSYTPAQFRELLENLTYTSKPGTDYLYSSGSTVVANIVASLYYNDYPERRVNDLLSEFLFSPLGMNSTKLHGWIDPALQDRITLPHRFNGTAGSFRSVPTTGINLGGASGCITSTAVDMTRLAAFILGDGIPAGSEIVQQAAAAGIGWGTGNRSVPNSSLSPNASNASKLGGWFGELFGRPSNSGRYGRTLAHGGAIGTGHQAYMIMCPDTKTAVVVLVNNMSSRGSLATQIMDRALNANYPLNTGIASYTEARAKEDIPRPQTPFNDFDDLVESYAGANANVDIVLNQDLTIELPMNNIRTPATTGITLTIRSANPSQPVTLTRGVSGNLFTVPYGATLIFRDIIIDGGNGGAFAESGGGTLVRVNSGGSFIMNAGTVLRNNVNSGEGGGVFVNTNGTFNMNSGTINGNTAATDGGVRVNGTFTMNGGEISGNTAVNNGGGVGATGGTFTMSGGEISGNTGTIGGGVRISSSGVFILANGKISNNTARSDGGGVSVISSAVFTMNGGEISGNNASSSGGGISISDISSTFNINGGEISGNTAGTVGGGVSVTSSAVSTMTGGEINDNSARDGGGVRVSGSGVFTLANGKIINNTATSGTGGCISAATTAGSIFNLNGGAVAGNGSALTNVVSGTHNLNGDVQDNAVVIAWNRVSGTLNYTIGTSTDLTVSAGAAATWANQSGVLGISYENGSNTGWIKQW